MIYFIPRIIFNSSNSATFLKLEKLKICKPLFWNLNPDLRARDTNPEKHGGCCWNKSARFLDLNVYTVQCIHHHSWIILISWIFNSIFPQYKDKRIEIWVFTTNSDFLIPFSLQPNIVDVKTMNSVRSNHLSLKYQRFTPSGYKDIGIRKFEFVAKTQFLLKLKYVGFYDSLWRDLFA